MVATTAERTLRVANIPVSSWSFAIRIWLATILALFVSFWLQLESPTTAALTVATLAQPTHGQALDKAGFRLLAIVVGVTAAIAITGLFSQERDLILAAFAVWIGICVFAAKLLDGYRCGAQKLVMQQRGKCGVTRQAQVPRRSFGMLAEGGALPRRMELPGPTSGAVASDCNR